MNKINRHIEHIIELFEDYINNVFEFIDNPFDPYGSITYQKRFSYEDRHKISKAVDELKQNPSVKSYTLSLSKETITISINN